MTLNPHYLWEAKMQNPYVKHGTFLVEFDDYVKSSKEINLHELGTKQNNFFFLMMKNEYHVVYVKDDVMFKIVVA
jgi:hypothetical protein